MFFNRQRNDTAQPKRVKANSDVRLDQTTELLSSINRSLLADVPKLNTDLFLQSMQAQYNRVLVALFDSCVGVINASNDDITSTAETMNKVGVNLESAIEDLHDFFELYNKYQLLMEMVNNKVNDFSISAFEKMIENIAPPKSNAPYTQFPSNNATSGYTGYRDGKFYAGGNIVSNRETMEKYIDMKRKQGVIINAN